MVGKAPNAKRFTVHLDFLAQRSEFFRAARSERWTEPGKATTLDDYDPEVFAAYLHCAYVGADSLKDCVSGAGEGSEPSQGVSQANAEENQVHEDDKNKAVGAKQGTSDEEKPGSFGDLSNLSGAANNDEKTGGFGDFGNTSGATNNYEDGSSESDSDSDSDTDADSNSESNDGSDNDREENSSNSSSNDPVIRTQKFLVDVYVLADELIDLATANVVIDNLIDLVQEHEEHSTATVAHVYKFTAAGSPLRKLMCDW